MHTADDLSRILLRIDGRGYKAYKDIEGSYDFGGPTMHIDHVQGDPFASPSKVRVRIPMNIAGLPRALHSNPVRRLALEDFLARGIRDALGREEVRRRGTGKSGLILVDAGGQEVLERTAIKVTPDWVEARLKAGLPAAGRRVLGRQADEMLTGVLPHACRKGLLWAEIPREACERFVECVENQEHIRSVLDGAGLAAFVANGSILPRESGASDKPMNKKESVPFHSPETLRVTVDLPNPVPGESGPVRTLEGMGIPKGVTLVVGGGYHGKSTLLKALERGVFPHVPGDGREYVVTSPKAVKIRAEDGRRIEKVNISPFINNLPLNRDTSAFSTDDASGSTSQAANIMEALEAGAEVLLLDEDTSATNFMVRDARMQALVQKENEPITPFLDRVRELHENLGVSTILVMGGCGDYFDSADTVVMMREYLPCDATDEAKRIAKEKKTERAPEIASPMPDLSSRIPLPRSFDASRGRRSVKIDAKAKDLVLFGSHPIELRCVEQLVDLSQTRAVGFAVQLAAARIMDGKLPLREVVEAVERMLDRHGLDVLDPFRRGEGHPGDFARPRRFEIAAALNRLRTTRFRREGRV